MRLFMFVFLHLAEDIVAGFNGLSVRECVILVFSIVDNNEQSHILLTYYLHKILVSLYFHTCGQCPWIMLTPLLSSLVLCPPPSVPLPLP
jgi:hypothetical protein